MAADRRLSRGIWRAGLLAFGFAGAASAQLSGYGTSSAATPPSTSAGTPQDAANATPAHGKGGWLIVPSIVLRGTVTDNVDQAPSGQARSDFITEVIPGIRIDGNGAHAKLHLDYQMDNLIYARDSSRNNLQNQLSAFGSLEAIENFFFVDARAAITQEAISPFGPRPTDNTSISQNRTETRTYQVSPYIRGRIADSADYLVRYDYTDQRSKSDAAGDSQVGQFTARLSGLTRLTTLSWTVEAIGQQFDNSLTRDTQDNRARGILNYAIDPQLRLNVTGGYERSDVITLQTTGNSTYGGGFEWAPTPRSKVYGNWERRFFGDGWNYGANHRTPYLAFTVSDTRDVVTDAQQSVAGLGFGAAYDLLFAALATRFPDPIDRAQEAQRLLHGGNIPSDLGLPPDFVVGSPYVERRQQASAAFLGVRNTLMFSVFRSTRDILGIGQQATAPTGLTTNTREWGAGLTFSHRLTGFSTLTASSTWSKTDSTSGTEITSTQWNSSVGIATLLGRRTTGSLIYRYTHFDTDTGSSSDYRENALIASLLMQF